MNRETRDIKTAKHLGQAVRDRRKNLRLTQGDLALQSGVSQPTISAIENGKNSAQIGLALRICADLGLRIKVEI